MIISIEVRDSRISLRYQDFKESVLLFNTISIIPKEFG